MFDEKMISDEEAKEILDKIFNRGECIDRIKEITQERVYYGISNFLFNALLPKIELNYAYGLFAESIILSGVCVEVALTEELAKEGYSKNRLKTLTLEKLIDSAKDKNIIEQSAIAHELRKLRDKYVHPDVGEAIARAVSSAKDLIQLIRREEKEKHDARNAIEKASKILLEIYSEQRYPLKEL